MQGKVGDEMTIVGYNNNRMWTYLVICHSCIAYVIYNYIPLYSTYIFMNIHINTYITYISIFSQLTNIGRSCNLKWRPGYKVRF